MITLSQLYNLGLVSNTDIFEGLTLPAGSPLDRDVLINTILERCGLNIPMYADPNVMRSAITVWAAKHKYTFEHVGKIYEASYSPIENTDKYEEVTTTKDRDLTDNTTGSNSRTEDLETNNKINVSEGKTSSHSGADINREEDTTSAYNAGSYQAADYTTSTLHHGEIITDSGNGTTNTDGSSTKNINGNIENNKTVNESELTKLINHTHGNIGVMDNATMQTKEYELLKAFNPYNFIASDLFENELTLFVY